MHDCYLDMRNLLQAVFLRYLPLQRLCLRYLFLHVTYLTYESISDRSEDV